jgi:outer membrane protein assembly factor BamD
MAQYEVHVANYYFRRGAYLAALNRSMAAVAEYQGAPAREEALYVMMRSYEKMGMEDLRKDTERVFLTNYPNSRFMKAGGGESWWKFWSKSDK